MSDHELTEFCTHDVHWEFGLTYASYLVWPRSLMQEMPAEWQHRFRQLAEEMASTWRLSSEYAVFKRGERGRFAADPLRLYRHPVGHAIDAERIAEPAP